MIQRFLAQRLQPPAPHSDVMAQKSCGLTAPLQVRYESYFHYKYSTGVRRILLRHHR